MRNRQTLIFGGALGLGFAALTASAWIALAQSGPPSDASIVPYQGFLELDGMPLNATVDLEFSLYTIAAGGAPEWSETHTAVPVTAGRFSVQLGAAGGLTQAVLAQAPYLGVVVDGAPLVGRQLFASVPYAWRGAPGQDFVVDGRLGLGTSTPAAELDVAGDADVRGYARLGGGIADSWFPHHGDGWAYVSGDGIIFRDDEAAGYLERMRVDDTGNVGIGTPVPQAPLHVAGNARVDGSLYAAGTAQVDGELLAGGAATRGQGVINTVSAGNGTCLQFDEGSMICYLARVMVDNTGPTISFPAAFANTHYAVVAMASYEPTAGLSTHVFAYADSKTRTGVRLRAPAGQTHTDIVVVGRWQN